MSQTVIVNVVTEVQQLAAGTVPAGIVFTIDGITPQTVAASPFTATFLEVPAGTYTVSAQAVNSTGGLLGAAIVSAPFTVEDPTVSVDIPTSITVTVQ